MKILDRYLVRGFVFPFAWCLFLFLVMAIIIDVFSFIDDIVKYKIPASSICAFYVYYTPTLFIQVTPMALLLSTIYLLSNLNKNNEIIAMKSSGLSLWRILTPLLLVGTVVGMLEFIVNDRVVPISARVSNMIRRDELEKAKQESRQQKKTFENVALYASGNRIIFARTYDAEKRVLYDIIIHEHDMAENLISKTTAQTGVWTGHGWEFHKVIEYAIDNAGTILGQPVFSDIKVIHLKERPGDFANREWKSDYLSYRQLKGYIKNFSSVGSRMSRVLQVDLQYKVAFPVISLIIILVAAPFALITTRGGVLIGMGMSVAIGLGYYAFIATSVALGKAGVLPPIAAAWLGNVIFLIVGIYLIRKRA